MFDGLFILTHLEINPTQGIHDIAVIWPCGDCVGDHRIGNVKIDALFCPGIGQIVHDLRLARFDVEGAAEGLLGLRPLFVALIGDAENVKQGPILLIFWRGSPPDDRRRSLPYSAAATDRGPKFEGGVDHPGAPFGEL